MSAENDDWADFGSNNDSGAIDDSWADFEAAPSTGDVTSTLDTSDGPTTHDTSHSTLKEEEEYHHTQNQDLLSSSVRFPVFLFLYHSSTFDGLSLPLILARNPYDLLVGLSQEGFVNSSNFTP